MSWLGSRNLTVSWHKSSLITGMNCCFAALPNETFRSLKSMETSREAWSRLWASGSVFPWQQPAQLKESSQRDTDRAHKSGPNCSRLQSHLSPVNRLNYFQIHKHFLKHLWAKVDLSCLCFLKVNHCPSLQRSFVHLPPLYQLLKIALRLSIFPHFSSLLFECLIEDSGSFRLRRSSPHQHSSVRHSTTETNVTAVLLLIDSQAFYSHRKWSMWW